MESLFPVPFVWLIRSHFTWSMMLTIDCLLKDTLRLLLRQDTIRAARVDNDRKENVDPETGFQVVNIDESQLILPGTNEKAVDQRSAMGNISESGTHFSRSFETALNPIKSKH